MGPLPRSFASSVFLQEIPRPTIKLHNQKDAKIKVEFLKEYSFSAEKKKEEEESTPELTPTTEKADFFISDEDDWYNIT